MTSKRKDSYGQPAQPSQTNRQQREAAQRERMAARFKNRPASPATADFDLPAPNDDVAQPDASAEPIHEHDLSTSKGGRAYLAEFFANRLHRHDFQRYITDTLAADFACVLSKWLSDSTPVAAQPSVPDGYVTVPQSYIDAVNDAAAIASAYSPCIDAVEEAGGENAEDPTWAIHHRLYYASFLLKKTAPTPPADGQDPHV